MAIELLKEEEDVLQKPLHQFDGLYLKRISPHISRLKSLLKDSSNGEVELKIKDIKNLMGEEFKNKNINSFYGMLKTILIEYGINVKLHHEHGANVILSFAKEEEIRPSIEIVRERMLKTAINAGYKSYGDYIRYVPSRSKVHKTNMYDKDSKKYFVGIGRKYVSILFPNPIINAFAMANQHTGDKGGYDWISNGLKVKHIASTLKHRVVKTTTQGIEDFEQDYFQWGIANNNKADIFILTAWGDSENLELMKAWIFKAHEIVNGREFWDRSALLISTHDRSILKYSEWEVDHDNLEIIRNKILHDQEIERGESCDVNILLNIEEKEIADIIRNDEKIRKENIENFYSTIFRTITWNMKDDKEQMTNKNNQ